MKLTVTLACIFLLVAPSLAQHKSWDYGLPADALIIETQPVGSKRALMLWMLNPTKHPRGEANEFYSCPEETRGSYLSGATRVSLVDTELHRIINTVKIKEYDDGTNEEDNDGDEFDIPYQIHAGSYYHVEGVADGQEGKPTIMWLKDYNGDGKATEFALFDAEACMALSTILVGYSERQDKVIQYPIRLTVQDEGKRSIEVSNWATYLFSKKPQRPGYWSYEIDYRGRAGTLDKYEIRYNEQAERFEGVVVRVPGE